MVFNFLATAIIYIIKRAWVGKQGGLFIFSLDKEIIICYSFFSDEKEINFCLASIRVAFKRG